MTGESDLRLDAAMLERIAAQAFEAEGLPADHAAMAARVLIAADRRGVRTHGILRVPAYVQRIRAGLINPRPALQFDRPMPFSHVLHADNALGPVAAQIALDACLDSARRIGIGAATVRAANHFGAASVYTVQAARQGFIGFAMAPGARSLAPFGSRAALFGTNPFAMAAPAGRHAPWSLDMAASVAARGHVRLAAQSGRPIPPDWALDAEGRPTTDPAAALKGVMLPFAGAKGSGLAMMVDILAGVLAGAGFAGEIRDWVADFGGPANVGHFFLVMDVAAFMPLASFEQRMETAIARLKALPPAEGVAEVMYPGERSGRAEAAAETRGVPVDAPTLAALRSLWEDRGLRFPDLTGPSTGPSDDPLGQ